MTLQSIIVDNQIIKVRRKSTIIQLIIKPRMLHLDRQQSQKCMYDNKAAVILNKNAYQHCVVPV